MNIAPKTYRAICFDLDGTLLPMDMDEFMKAYFKSIAGFAAGHGLDAELFMQALNAGIKAMTIHRDDLTNEETFWNAFASVYGTDETAQRVRPLSDMYYDTDFGLIGNEVHPYAAVERILKELTDKGYTLVLATMPMFPLRAIQWRCNWAGIDDPGIFARITTFENSKAIKPNPEYFAEVLAALGVEGKDVLMVGNNTEEDLTFMNMGADGYLTTDFLLDPVGFDLDTVAHGSMEDFESWISRLPVCDRPLGPLEQGVIDSAAVARALAANAPDMSGAQRG